MRLKNINRDTNHAKTYLKKPTPIHVKNYIIKISCSALGLSKVPQLTGEKLACSDSMVDV